MRRFLLFFLFGCLIFTGCRETSTPPKVIAGWYGDHLQVAFHPVSKEWSAIYHDADSPADTCQIYLVGKLLGPKANLISWKLDKRKNKAFGIIQYEADNQLSIVLEAEINACQKALGFNLDETRTFRLTEAMPWIRIQSVKRATAYLLNEAKGIDTLEALHRYDIVRTINQREDWVQVSVPKDSSEVIGWLPVAHLRRFPG